MKVSVKKGGMEKIPSEAIFLLHFADSKKLGRSAELLDKATDGLLTEVIGSGDFKGELHQTYILLTRQAIPAKRILLVGCGKKSSFNLVKLRTVVVKAGQKVRDLGWKSLTIPLSTEIIEGVPLEDLAQLYVEGIYSGLYRFTEFRTAEGKEVKELRQLTLVGEDDVDLKRVREGVNRGEIISSSLSLARDLVSSPGNKITPTMLAETAQRIARENSLKCKVLGLAQIEKLGMGAFLAVAKGSQEPAKFITLEYRPKVKGAKTIALVGKGITFDSGGISIKPSKNMDKMKADMAGGAVVIGVTQAVSQLNLPLHVVAIIPATENLPSGSAYKPGDVLSSFSRQTVEVTSTDAEGRLILADALAYSLKYHPSAVIDVATLTGACVIALGDYVTGMLGNDDDLMAQVKKASGVTGEMVWELPLLEEYFEYLKSDIADFKNAGGREAGTIQGAIFLSKFVKDRPWVHLDIAGTAWIDKDKPYHPRGATGIGVRLLVQVLRQLSE